jgi:hypothetical protein
MSPSPPSVTAPVDVVAVPKATAASSFILHAPLELLARVGLLQHLPPEQLDDGLAGIARLVEQYRAAGEPVEDPAPVPIDSIPSAASLLVDALRLGDADRVDALAASLLPRLSPWEAVGLLGPAIVTSLAAAGHAPIGLALLTRVGSLPTALLRGPLRSVAARPEWQVDWFRTVDGGGDPDRLYDALCAVPRLGRPGSDFIHPLMSQVQDSGVAAQVLGPVLPAGTAGRQFDVVAATRTLTRTAAWSMIHDDPDQAPYGWTHSLTMPQAVMTLAGAGVEARTAFAVAATFLAGFRAAHGQVDLPAHIIPEPMPDVTPAELALAASRHEDAHLVKFTLACLHAADDDPTHRSLYLAAAAHLLEWWRRHG